MLPIRDENPRVRTPWITISLIVMNALAWAVLQGFGQPEALLASICRYGLIPGVVTGEISSGALIPLGPDAACRVEGPAWVTFVSSMFMHGGWFHIIANLWFLWIFGDNVEDAMGPLRFLAFYLLCGVAAAFAQILTDPGSPVPMVGASGAISGVMGAYALLYPRARVDTLVFLGIFVTIVAVPAWLMLGYWVLLQVLGGIPALAGATGGVAFWAHIGGFIAGLALVYPLHKREYVEQHRQQEPRLRARYRF